MKKHMMRSALALLLMAGALFTVAVSAGSDGESLVSRSWLYQRFLPRAQEAIGVGSGSDDGSYARDSGQELWELDAGERVALGAGQTAILLEGRAKIHVEGTILNLSMGMEAGSGFLNRNQRYLLCENSEGVIEAQERSVLAVSPGAEDAGSAPAVTPTPTPSGGQSPFTDVPAGQWYHDDLVAACERGLINGLSPQRYGPGENLTVAQCVKLAAAMHQLWHEGEVTLTNAPAGAWYRSYADYALLNGILTAERNDYDRDISRRDFVQIFFRALPGSSYGERNRVDDGAIPDVPVSDEAAYEIYAFYRAGILTGYDDGSFAPDAAISRAEVATILNRMMDDSARKSVERIR